MWGWIIKVTIISLLLIFLLHYLYSFFKTTLTSPKLKDLVNKPQAKYNTIYNSIKSVGDNYSSQNLGEDNKSNSNNHSNITNMKDELKKYLKELNSNTGSSNNSGGSSDNNIGLSSNSVVSSNFNMSQSNNENISVYSPSNIMSNVGANGISTRVNNAPNYMPNINKLDKQPTVDYATPSMSSSYSSPYSPY
jgi:hypothetical protein